MHVAFLRTAAEDGRNVEYEKQFLKELEISGVKIYFIGNETRKKPWLGMMRLKKYVKDNDIDICHTHLAYGIVFSTLLEVPVVYTHHNINRRWGKSMYTIFNRLVDEYVGISDICSTALMSYTGREVNTITNAVALDKFEEFTRVRAPDNQVKIAMVGRLIAAKDYMNLLKALTLLNENVKEQISISIAGEGEKKYKDKLIEYIEEHDLQSKVNLIGVTNDIPKFLYDADLFVMSSAWEGLPIALTEAAISGLPCIVTDVGGCSEVISRSNNGVVVEPHDSQALADEITKLVNNKVLIEELSQNAVNTAEQYSIKRAADLHIELYKSML